MISANANTFHETERNPFYTEFREGIMLFNYTNIKQLNDTELYVCKYITDHPEEVFTKNIRELAEGMNVAPSTIVRFAKKLGCDGFQDFRDQFREYLNSFRENSLEERVNLLSAELRRYTTEDYQEKIDAFVSRIYHAHLTVIYGIGKSAGLAIYAARNLNDIGYNCIPITDPFYPEIRSHSNHLFFVIISHSGETKESIAQLYQYKGNHCPVGCITAHPDSTIAVHSDCVLDYNEPDFYTPSTLNLSSEAPVSFLIEMIARKLIDKRLPEEQISQ